MSDGWPFDESFEEIVNLDAWTETTETHAVPPHVAARMRELSVTREPSEKGLPLTVDALTALIMSHWPAPAVEAVERRDETGVTFRWMNFFFVAHTNLFIEQFQLTPEGVPINPAVPHGTGHVSDLWPRTNSATRSFERILRLALEGNPPKLVVLDEEHARLLIEKDPKQVFLFWRGSRIGYGKIALCARHVRMWPRLLGPLRLAHLSPQLHADLACSSGAAVQSIAHDIYDFYSGGRGRVCRGCAYEAMHPTLGPFYGLTAVGPEERGYNFDDGYGPLSMPEYGQPIMTLSTGPMPVEYEPFTCERCGAVKPRVEGTPCEGCGKGVCMKCLASDTRCPSCRICALCGAAEGEQHDQAKHADYFP